jgi:uncharacterized protein with von Willebrand factor type A (vWA) domain
LAPRLPEPGPPGISARLIELGEALRSENVAVGTSELLDAFDALNEVPWTVPEDFREALAATLAKSPEDRRIFELVFDRFFFRATEAAAVHAGIREQGGQSEGGEGQPGEGEGSGEGGDIDLDALREAIAKAIQDGDESALRDLARLAIAAFGRQGTGSGVIGVDVQRIRRSLGLRAEPQPELPEDDPRRPEIFVLCDVSTSVTSASVFFLSVLHALHDTFRKMRSFVFIERISEVTEVFERERDFQAVNQAISRDAGVADISGYTDYGRVWDEFRDAVADELHPRATIIVLGDARTNGRDPRADVFGQVASLAGRTFWLNPEPRLYWNYGDSVIAAYEQYCHAYECWTTQQLEEFVKDLTKPMTA